MIPCSWQDAVLTHGPWANTLVGATCVLHDQAATQWTHSRASSGTQVPPQPFWAHGVRRPAFGIWRAGGE
eukprot:2706830-Alexandrium_andersonii.AAC.1